MNGENRLAEKQYTADDTESVVYQQAVMMKVQDKIEVFIRQRVCSMINVNVVTVFFFVIELAPFVMNCFK